MGIISKLKEKQEVEQLMTDMLFEMLEEQFLTNDTSITYANAWDFKPSYELPQNFQCGGIDNSGKFLKVDSDGYIRPTAVEPGTGVPQEYVDQQDQRVLETATERFEEGARDLTNLINGEAQARTDEDARLEGLIEALDATKAGIDYVRVSASGSSTNEVSYITIGDTEYKLAGGGSAPTNMVTTDTPQEISGGKNFTGYLTQNNDPVVTSSMLSTYATLVDLNQERDIRAERDEGLLNNINQLNDRVVDIERQEDNWNGKSVVTVSGSGTSTSTINYMTVNGYEYRFGAVTGDVTKAYVDEQDALKQNKTDNSLATTNKTVVGAINELNTKFNTELLEGDACFTPISSAVELQDATSYTYSTGRVLNVCLNIFEISYSLIEGHEVGDLVVIGHLNTTKRIDNNTCFYTQARLDNGTGLLTPIEVDILASFSYDDNAVQIRITDAILQSAGSIKFIYLNCHTLLKEN